MADPAHFNGDDRSSIERRATDRNRRMGGESDGMGDRRGATRRANEPEQGVIKIGLKAA